MYRTKAQKLMIRLKGITECNHPLQYIEPFTWNDKLTNGTYGPQYPGFICGLCYDKVDLPASIVRRYPNLPTEENQK